MRLLFVCMGNICRSPAAEGVMKHQLQQAGLKAEVDSAGTINFHTGKLPDERMRRAAARRGIQLTHPARQVRASDLVEFDLVLVMDSENLRNVRRLDPMRVHHDKIIPFCEFCTGHDETEVPDPYTGGDADFEHVLDLLEDGCAELVRRIKDGTLSA